VTTARYDAFVSYSHEDAVLADRVSRRLRRYRPPRAASARRRLEVFRDRERLTASADLGHLLEGTVSASEHLVLLASPAAARSRYVDLEVATFLDRKGLSGIVVVMCDGDLPEALPTSLRERVKEPLYVDLRRAGRREFRLETLRIIAALHGVDYSELRREDDLRRLRNSALAVGATIAVAVGLGSAYLVNTTPADAWEQVTQPSTRAGQDPLMPVQRVAIDAHDPRVVVWLGDNARYERDLAGVKETWTPPSGALRDPADVRARLEAAGLNAAGRPVATAALEATSGSDVVGTGELRVYAVLEHDGLRYARTFRFVPTDPNRPGLDLPLTLLDADRRPFDLEPWPADALRRAGFDSVTIAGTVTDHATGERSPRVEFSVSDHRAEIREVLQATAGPEHVVLSSSETHASRLRERLEESGADDLWDEIAADPQWVTYRPPNRRLLSSFPRRSSDVRADATMAGLDPALVAALDPSSLDGDLVEFEQVSRATGDTHVAIATLAGVLDHQEVVAAPKLTYYFRSPHSNRWASMRLPVESAATRIVDVVPAASNRRTVVVVTEREGLFRTTNAGETWERADFGESRLRNSPRVVLSAGESFFALVSAGNKPGDGPNPLFRLVRRDWIRRWRLGLARILAAQGGGAATGSAVLPVLNGRSIVSFGSTETGWSRQSQRSISGSIAGGGNGRWLLRPSIMKMRIGFRSIAMTSSG
jgi:hypothetical protein